VSRALLTTTADHSYVDQTKQLFSSAFYAGEWRGDAGVLTTGLEKADADWFESRGIRVFNLRVPFEESWWAEHSVHTRFPPIVTLRYHLFTPLFASWDTIIYLDADAIVLGSLQPLTTFTRFAAVPDIAMTVRDNFTDLQTAIRAAGSEKAARAHAFNSGVLVIPGSGRLSSAFGQCITMTQRYMSCLRFPDQAVLNAVFANSWERVPYRYNARPIVCLSHGRIQLGPFYRHPEGSNVILHFAGLCKPWHRSSVFRARWNRFRSTADQLPAEWSTVQDDPPKSRPGIRFASFLVIQFVRFIQWSYIRVRRGVERTFA